MAVEYYSQRASFPGTLLITEATYISPASGGVPNVPGIYTPAHVTSWKNIVEAVHAKGCFIYLQLQAVGRGASAAVLATEDASLQVVSASDVALEGGDKLRPLSEGEIKQYLEDYAAAAKAFVEEAGGDGVEINAANGFLIDQFTQTTTNKRTDQYGGSVENRVRFALDVVAAVVGAVGASKVGLRLSPFSEAQGEWQTESFAPHAKADRFESQASACHAATHSRPSSTSSQPSSDLTPPSPTYT